jgi:uncharacterized delta-60 repeat protein
VNGGAFCFVAALFPHLQEVSTVNTDSIYPAVMSPMLKHSNTPAGHSWRAKMTTSNQTSTGNMSGKIDLAFGTNGVVQINIPDSGASDVSSVINGPDGSLFACGTVSIQHLPHFFVVALRANGDIIRGFGDNGYVTGKFDFDASYGASLMLAGEKLLLAGSAYIGTDPFPALARLDLQGAFDPTFGVDGTGRIVLHIPGPPEAEVSTDRPETLSLNSATNAGQTFTANMLNDGKILLTHYFVRVGAPSYGVILRTQANGLLDTGFANKGVLSVIAPGFETGQTQIQSVAVDSAGRYLACGSVSGLDTKPVKTFFARYNSEGQSDHSFGLQGFRIIQEPEALPGGSRSVVVAPIADGHFFSGGYSVHDPYVAQLLKLTAQGELDPAFNQGKPLNTRLADNGTVWRALTIGADGKPVVAGTIDKRKNTFTFDIVVARFNESGQLDTDFNDGLGWARTRLSSAADGATSVLLQNDKICIGGISNFSGIIVRYHA